MASGTSELPAVARRRVRLFIRHAREEKQLTQGQVAEAMEWSLSKVMRIESGEVTISPNDLRPLLAHLGVTDQSRVDELVQQARSARRRQMWWDEPRYRDHLSLATRQLIQYEAEATEVRYFNTTILPGRFQTRAYAEAVFQGHRNELTPAGLEIGLEARLRRRTELLSRKNPPLILLLLDESALYREIGGPQVLAGQLASLLDDIRAGRALARVVRFSVALPIPPLGAYELLNLGSDDNAVLYREGLVDDIVEDPVKVAAHRKVFETVWDLATHETASEAFIADRLTAVRRAGRRKPTG